MRKIIAATAVGLALVAGQAAASNAAGAQLRVGDRVGARVGAEKDLVGVPLFVLVAGGVIAAAVLYETVIKDDEPKSP